MRLLPSIRTTIVTAVLAMSVACTPPDDKGTGGGAGGGVFSSGGGFGTSGGGVGSTGGGSAVTGGGDGTTGGGSAVTGGGDGTTGGGSAVTGGGDGTPGGGSAVTGGGDGTTGGGSAVTGGGDGTTGGGTAVTGGGTATGGGSAVTGGGTATGGGSAVTGGGTATGGGTGTTVGETCANAVALDVSSPMTNGGLTGSVTFDFATLTDDYDGSCNSSTGGPEGVFELTLTQDRAVHISLASADGDPVLYVRASPCDTGTEVECVDNGASGTTEVLNGSLVPAGTYYIFVEEYGGVSASTPATLTVELTDPPVAPTNDTCGTAETLVFTDNGNGTSTATVSGDTTLATNGNVPDAEVSCSSSADQDGQDVVYLLHLDTPQHARVVVTPNGSYEPAVYIRAGTAECANDSAEIACVTSSSGPATVEPTGVLAAGDYFIWVDTYVEQPGAFTMEVTLTDPTTACGNGIVDTSLGETCDDGPPADGDGCSSSCTVESGYYCTGAPSNCATLAANDACGGAELLVFADNGDGTSTATASGDTTTASNNNVPGAEVSCSSSADQDGQDLIYLLHLDAPMHARVVVTPTGTYEPVVYIRAGASNCSNDSSEISCAAFSSGPVTIEPSGVLAAGDYFIWVDTYVEQPGAFSMAVTLTDPASVCGNGIVDTLIGETCDDGPPADGDGCTAQCQVEVGWVCTGSPSVCALTEQACGDGLDNDSDGATDGADSDCVLPAYFPACAAGTQLYVYASGSIGQTVPGTPGVSNTVTVAGFNGVIYRAAVVANLTHPYDGDLSLSLTPPGGSAITLSNGAGSGADFTATVFDSTCAAGISSGSSPFSDCYAPSSTLAGLVAQPADGAWRFTALDTYTFSDTGTLDSWKLVLCGGAAPVCGNGVIEVGEGCDDGDASSGNGCSSACQVEVGYACSGTPSVCVAQTILLNENFDTATVPALPAGWSSVQLSGTTNTWVTQSPGLDSTANLAFASDLDSISDSALVSPSIAISATTASLQFKHTYDLEDGYDGAVLEVSVDGAAFQDVLAATGASFTSGGYSTSISTSYSNPIGGQDAWTGVGTNVVSVISLGALNGHSIQLRWRMASDSSGSSTGWSVDSVVVTQ